MSRTCHAGIRCLLFVAAFMAAKLPSAWAQFGDSDVGWRDSESRHESLESKRKSNLRRSMARVEAERSELVAFGAGALNGSTRVTVRKHLRAIGADDEAARELAKLVSSLPANDFTQNERLLGVVNDGGDLPAPPVLLTPAKQCRGRERFEAAWTACIDALRDGGSADLKDVANLREWLAVWKSAEPTTSDRRRRLAIDGYFRDLAALVDLLAETRRADRLRTRLVGFPGGTVSELVNWILDHNVSVKSGTTAHGHIRTLSAHLVRHFDRSRNRAGNESPDWTPTEQFPIKVSETTSEVSPNGAPPREATPTEFSFDDRDDVDETVVPQRKPPQPTLQPEPDVGSRLQNAAYPRAERN